MSPGASWALLRFRAAVVAAVRGHFEGRGSVEVETPAIVRSPGVDAFLDAPRVELRPGGPAGKALVRYLHTSPEYAMKRLLADGAGAIHQIGKAFRDGELGRLHEPEFTMLEWYRPGATDADLMSETEELVRHLAERHSGGLLVDRGRTARCTADRWPRRTFREVFQSHAGVDPDMDDEGRLGRVLRAAGTKPPKGTTREELLDMVLGLVVQPMLGVDVPEFVVDWPADRAALARLRPGADGAAVAARFELYACGVELCNGYHELLDAGEQRARIEVENRRRIEAGKEPMPVDPAFLDALARGLPDCAGNALGLDRLILLLAAGAGHDVADLGDVRAFRLDLEP